MVAHVKSAAQIYRTGIQPKKAEIITYEQEQDSAIDSADAKAQLALNEIGSPGASTFYYFSTRTVAIAAHIPVGITALITGGYAAEGDGGGTYYRLVGAGPATVGRFQSADGQWWEFADREINVLACGAVGGTATGSATTDDTAALQAAFNYAATVQKKIVIPRWFKVTSQITIAADYTNIEGEGQSISGFVFAPTADATCIQFKNGSSLINTCSITRLAFYSSDSTYRKIAIEAVNTSGLELGHIKINGSVVENGTDYWSGGVDGSIGLRTKGRETATIHDVFVAADIPLNLAKNPTSGTSALEDLDHFHFSNLTLIANGFPNIVADSGVYFSDTSFDGYQAWVLGTHGFYWHDTTGTSASLRLSFRGVRVEQGVDGSAYSFYLSSNSSLQNLDLEGCAMAVENNGIYCNNVTKLKLDTTTYPNASGQGLTAVGAAGSEITMRGCFWQIGSSFSITNYAVRWVGQWLTSYPLPSTAVYGFSNDNTNDAIINAGVFQIAASSDIDGSTLPNGTTILLHPDKGNGSTGTVIRISAFGGTKTLFCCAVYNPNVSGTPVLSFNGVAYTGCAIGGVGGDLCLIAGSTDIELLNNTGEALRYIVEMSFLRS